MLLPIFLPVQVCTPNASLWELSNLPKSAKTIGVPCFKVSLLSCAHSLHSIIYFSCYPRYANNSALTLAVHQISSDAVRERGTLKNVTEAKVCSTCMPAYKSAGSRNWADQLPLEPLLHCVREHLQHCSTAQTFAWENLTNEDHSTTNTVRSALFHPVTALTTALAVRGFQPLCS